MNSIKKTAILGIVLAGCGIAVGIGYTNSSSAGADQDALVIRGVKVDRDTFDMEDLTPDAMAQAIDAYERDIFTACMADRGFKSEPISDEVDTAYELRYEQAATGYDGGDPAAIKPQMIDLPDGSTYPITTTQTSDSCWWKAWSSLGHDPMYRFALSMRLTDLAIEASHGADSALERARRQYATAAENQVLVSAYVEMRDAEFSALPDEFKP